ncbi:hypothetical protein [Oscillibacter sp.]|uniref:hypothetical protein n=1 Tax=Oscillibacter sp. TaxID=1945593 RepID=UPI002D7ED686|nr:hypothetical protein [Oscillibacter sp.]
MKEISRLIRQEAQKLIFLIFDSEFQLFKRWVSIFAGNEPIPEGLTTQGFPR